MLRKTFRPATDRSELAICCAAAIGLLAALPLAWLCRPEPRELNSNAVAGDDRRRHRVTNWIGRPATSSDVARVVYVFGEPALLFQLYAQAKGS